MLCKIPDTCRDIGLLVLRLGLGTMFIVHGWPKIAGGPEHWAQVGGAMGNFGIHFAPTFWGFMASLAEFGGGIALVLGLLTRPACALLTITMIVAAAFHLMPPDPIPAGMEGMYGFGPASHALEAGIVFLSLILIGPGKYSLDQKLCGKCCEKS